MDRRAFLGAGGVGLVGAWLDGGPAGAAGNDPEREIEESGRYRLIRDIPRVDWIVVTPETAPVPGFSLELIDLDAYPQGEAALVIPFGGQPAELSLRGPVPHTTTVSWRQDEQRLVQHHWFEEPAAAKVYVRTGAFKDVVVLCRPRR